MKDWHKASKEVQNSYWTCDKSRGVEKDKHLSTELSQIVTPFSLSSGLDFGKQSILGIWEMKKTMVKQGAVSLYT